jgi:hypothetical protein
MNLTPTKLLRLLGGTLLPLWAATPSFADLESTRAALIEWSRVKNLVSKERTEWTREKEMMADTLGTARTEVSLLDEKIDSLNASSTEADRKRADLTGRIDAAKSTAAGLAEKAAEGESAVKELLPVLPEPLKLELQPLLQRLPADPSNTRLSVSQRIQTLVGLLAQIEKFQSTINLVSEIKDLGSGESAEVKTLYFGLSAAFFSDSRGTVAGYGAPKTDGWHWTSAAGDVAARIANAIAIHESTVEPAFVLLPVEIH